MPLTQDNLDRAARTLHAIAAIPSLHDGIVTFAVDGLEGGWWYEGETWFDTGSLDRIWVPVVGAMDLAECRLKINVAIEEGQRVALDMIASEWPDYLMSQPNFAARMAVNKLEAMERVQMLEIEEA